MPVAFFTGGSGYSDIVQKPAYNANMVFGDRYGKSKKLGAMASGSFYQQLLSSDDHQTTLGGRKMGEPGNLLYAEIPEYGAK